MGFNDFDISNPAVDKFENDAVEIFKHNFGWIMPDSAPADEQLKRIDELLAICDEEIDVQRTSTTTFIALRAKIELMMKQSAIQSVNT